MSKIEQIQLPVVATEKPANPQQLSEVEKEAEELFAPAPTHQSMGTFKQGELKATEKIEMQRAMAEVGFSFEAAQRIGRDEQYLAKRLVNELCKDPYFCGTALYRVPRGDDKVEGLGIGSALAIKQIWGHMETGYVEHGRYGTESQYMAYCWDMVTNNKERAPFTITTHGVNAKTGEYFPVKNVNDKIKARASTEKRNCILQSIPPWIKRAMIKQIKRTLYETVRDVDKSWDFLVKEFAKFGVDEKMMLRYVNCPDRKKLAADDVLDCQLIYNHAREEASAAPFDEAFPERNKKEAAKEADKNTPAATSKPANPNSQSGSSQANAKQPTAKETTSQGAANAEPPKSSQQETSKASTEPASESTDDSAATTSQSKETNTTTDAPSDASVTTNPVDIF